MEIGEVRDKSALIDFINALPDTEKQERVQRLANRNAARLFPISIRELTFRAPLRNENEVLAIFLCLCLANLRIVPSSIQTFQFQGELKSTLRTALDRMSEIYSNDPSVGQGSSYSAALCNVDAMGANSDANMYRIVRLNPMQSFNDATIQLSQLWQRDLCAAEECERLFAPYDIPSMVSQNWDNSKRILFEAGFSKWDFWIAWYDRLLEGRKWMPEAVAHVISQISSEDWNKGPAHINPMFDEVLALYRAEDFIDSNPYGFRASINDAGLRLNLHPVETVDLSEVIQKLSAAFRDYNRRVKRVSDGNQLAVMCKDALDPEISDLKKEIKKCKGDAQALHYQLKRYEKHIMRVLKDKDLPGTAETVSLLDDLRDAQDSICLISAPVREAEKQRHALALERATNDQLLMAIRNCAGMATDGEGQMRIFATLAMKALASPDTSAEEKQMAWMFAYRMGVESAVLIKTHEDEGKTQKGTFGKRIKEAADLMVATDKGIDVVQEAAGEIASAPWHQPILEFISQNLNIPGAS